MNKIILKILSKLVKRLNVIIENYKKGIATPNIEYTPFTIAGKYESGEKLQMVKPVTIERVLPLKIYNLIVGGYLDFYCSEQYFMKYTDAIVFPQSDFILTENKAIWDKFYNPVFTKNIPMDKDLGCRIDNELYINTNKEIVNFKRAFSLCGVHADVWSHFMIQYLPMLYYSTEVEGLFDNELTILVPEYTDEHLKEVLDSFIEKLKNVKVQTLLSNQMARCEELIYMESATQMIDHEKYVSYSDMIIPKKIALTIKENLVTPFITRFYSKELITNPKLYIRRKNAIYRNILNVDELEEFFINEGFTIIEPHLLSFSEKVNLFHNADFIAGPNSAGFSNLIFSQPKTKVLMFSNLQRAFEPYLSFFDQHFDLNFLTVTGNDEDAADSHSSFYIPMEKVKAAYKQLAVNSKQNVVRK